MVQTLSFDDTQNVENWYAHRKALSKWKCVFYICPTGLTKKKVRMLNVLLGDGHRIGCHGLNHVRNEPVKDILTAKRMLEDLGFVIDSYAFPYGQVHSVNELKKHFKLLRGCSVVCGGVARSPHISKKVKKSENPHAHRISGEVLRWLLKK
jgi:hypothetical protein